jgi:ssDNA-binding Zn-finger/Zn-ribbon topoisomerase 1
VGETCPLCGEGTLTARRGRFGPFVGCDRYPDCRYIHKPAAGPVETFGTCPVCHQGVVTTKRARSGRTFYGCDRYPDCDFATSTRPGPEGAVAPTGDRPARARRPRTTARTRRRA